MNNFIDTNYNPIPASLASLCTDMKTEDRTKSKQSLSMQENKHPPSYQTQELSWRCENVTCRKDEGCVARQTVARCIEYEDFETLNLINYIF